MGGAFSFSTSHRFLKKIIISGSPRWLQYEQRDFALLNIVDATVDKLLHRYVVVAMTIGALDVQPMLINQI